MKFKFTSSNKAVLFDSETDNCHLIQNGPELAAGDAIAVFSDSVRDSGLAPDEGDVFAVSQIDPDTSVETFLGNFMYAGTGSGELDQFDWCRESPL